MPLIHRHLRRMPDGVLAAPDRGLPPDTDSERRSAARPKLRGLVPEWIVAEAVLLANRIIIAPAVAGHAGQRFARQPGQK